MVVGLTRRFRWLAVGSTVGVLGLGLVGSSCLFRGDAWDFTEAFLFMREVLYSNRSPWSPDGQSLLFNDRSSPSGLHRLHLDGSPSESLALGRVVNASWSPDGTTLLYAAFEGPMLNFDLWLQPTDGTNRRRLATTFRDFFFTYAWSPDGQWIAYASDSIELVRPDASERRSLGPGSFPVWSPDGTRLASLIPDGWIQVSTVDGSSRSRITTGFNPSWSPDGAKLAFCECPDVEDPRADVFVVDADGSNRVRLCEGRSPRWSPDGSRILIQRKLDQLLTIAPDGSSEQVLAQDGHGACWSPDGLWIAFLDSQGAAVIRPDGSGRRSLGRGKALEAGG